MNDGSSLLHPEPRPSHIRKNFLGLWAPPPAAPAAPAAVPGRASLFLSSSAPLQRLREKAATRLYTLQTESLNIESRLYDYNTLAEVTEECWSIIVRRRRIYTSKCC